LSGGPTVETVGYYRVSQGFRDFEWQEGYGAFSIGISGVAAMTAYIENQAEHHRKKSFKDELKQILKKHQIEYEESMLD
jgi:putative transposase